MKSIVKKFSLHPLFMNGPHAPLRKRALSTFLPNAVDSPVFGSYKNALIRKIDLSLPEKAIRLSDPDSEISMKLALDQHDNLSKALISAGVAINELPSDDLPDSVFVEDTVVIVGDIAMITYPGALSRRPETVRVKSILESSYGSSINVIQQTEGTLDGGDVLFTGES